MELSQGQQSKPGVDIGRPLVDVGVVLRFGFALAYAILSVIIYERLSYRWYYFGFIWGDPSVVDVISAILCAALPALFLPRGVRNLHQFAAWVLYYSVFAPSILVPMLQHLQSGGEIWLLTCVVTIGACVFNLSSRLRDRAIPSLDQFRFRRRTIIGFILTLYFAGYAYILIAHGADFNLASFEDVYEQRADFAAGAAWFMNYLVPILSNVVSPLLLALGLRQRNPALIALGIGGSVISYGTFAAKQHILTPGFVIGTYLLFDRADRCRIAGVPITLVLISLLCLPIIASYDPNEGLLGTVISMLFVRTLLLPGVIAGLFSSYFSIYEHTYFAHSNVGRLFADYPYGDLSVGQVVGYYLLPSSGPSLWELNGSFVVTDGIASLGILGIAIAFALAIVVIQVMAMASVKVDQRLVYPAVVPFLITLANTSLFSSMLTGGGAILTILFYLWSNAASEPAAAPRLPNAMREPRRPLWMGR